MIYTGKIIKEERLQKKMSQRNLAEVLGVTQDSVSLWEKGKRLPATEHIIALCKYFGISADYLLGLDKTK
ncbi:MAG: helix-turn-helix domain-containing protein [Clostridia bacterium]|nr:helix-turn-helix domain-containing protein [Clostridia bacterium]